MDKTDTWVTIACIIGAIICATIIVMENARSSHQAECVRNAAKSHTLIHACLRGTV